MSTTALRTSVRVRAALAVAMAASVLVIAPPAWANHPVFVEGNCFGPGMGDTATGLRQSPVEPGTCGDYDGDGRIGMAEDNDGDNNFGTINAALTAVAQNGRVTIVANGTYGESSPSTQCNGPMSRWRPLPASAPTSTPWSKVTPAAPPVSRARASSSTAAAVAG